MPNITNENKEKIQKKLEYIGLNFKKVPSFLKSFEPLNYRPLKFYDETSYKVYQYINVLDIQIMLTPTERLKDVREKYKLASPIYTYLDSENEENIEKFITFLRMTEDVQIENIEKIEEEQQSFSKQIPYEIKYEDNYIWQIYYSDYAKKYFMLVPTNEKDNSALFYLLKKQIESKKTRKKINIYVPISHLEYSGAFLSKSEISDIENYLWYFTKDWPSVYEVYDKKNNRTIQIVGKTNVYEKIKSEYKINLQSRDLAVEEYKLLKALFILATGIPEEYKFETKINENGELEFYYKDKKIVYSEFGSFIKEEYLKRIGQIKKEIKENKKLKKRLETLNTISKEKEQEFLNRQKQIATFLECKKTFLGKVKYFFKKKKNNNQQENNFKVQKERKEENKSEIEKFYEEKEQYTIEDLIDISTKLENKLKENKNINLDINAIENKNEVLDKKIENADLYIKEIEKHKKSIFEFWKFTNKAQLQALQEAEEEQKEKREKILKYFNFETDLEELGNQIDDLQRRKLSKNETDAIFAAKQVLNSIREIEKEKADEVILKREMKNIQNEYKKDIKIIKLKDFDIFGSMSDDKTKIKIINNTRHREIEKDKYKVLNVNLDTTVEEYKNTLKEYLNLIREALHKIQSPYNMPVYMAGNSTKLIKGLQILDLNPEKAIEKEINNEEINLYRINLLENTPSLFYSNIVFYDNFNKTLPLGMNLSTEVLLNTSILKLEKKQEINFNINYKKDIFNIETKNITLHEYDVIME